MAVHIFTSISLNYLPKARILASTLKRFHPEWIFHLLISDRLGGGEEAVGELAPSRGQFDRICWIDALDISSLDSWIFKHSMMEICTAVKGPFLQQLAAEGATKIIYLDPDIAVFNSLQPLVELLERHAILLTPHLLDYSNDPQAILDNEMMGVMRHGIFNLGFLAINASRSDGARFVQWWGNRLRDYCYADYERGLFTDQKWCDLVPAYFTDYQIVRDPGYDVASWNIDKRDVSMRPKGQIQVDGKYPLRFYHFTGYDSGAGDAMTRRYAEGNRLIGEIWSWYGRQLRDNGQEVYGGRKPYFNYYDNGVEIPDEARRIYRQRTDLQQAFPNPYKTGGDAGRYHGGFHSWYTRQNRTVFPPLRR
jgi:hypothetical protein